MNDSSTELKADAEGYAHTGKASKKAIFVVAIIFVTLILAIIGIWKMVFPNGSSNHAPYPGPQVEQALDGIPSGAKIGVVVSYTEDPTQGAGWDGNGEGITIAKWRLAQNGTRIDTVVVSDQGTSEGAADAINQLKEQNVSAVVALTSGNHTNRLAKEASAAGLPIVFPYESALSDYGDATWYGFPDPDSLAKKLEDSAKALSCSPFIVLDKAPAGLDSLIIVNSTDEEQRAQELKKIIKDSRTGCIFIDQPPAQMAQTISDLQSHQINAKFIAGRYGTNSQFQEELASSSLSGLIIFTLAPAKTAMSDTESLGFAEARSLMQQGNTEKALRDDAIFSERATLSDTSSYEAFMAVARSIARAKSYDPQHVQNEISKLVQKDAESVDGVSRDFSNRVYQNVELAQIVSLDGNPTWVSAEKR